MLKQSWYTGQRYWIITLTSTDEMVPTDPGVFLGLLIFVTYSCYPAISLVRIRRETVEMESTTFTELIGASHSTATLFPSSEVTVQTVKPWILQLQYINRSVCSLASAHTHTHTHQKLSPHTVERTSSSNLWQIGLENKNNCKRVITRAGMLSQSDTLY